MRARVPASTANLGPGFDALALALSLYVEVDVEPAGELRIIGTGEGSDLPTGPDHLAAQVVRTVTGHDRFTITVDSEIPVGRGLGSSASLAVAAAAAAGAADPLAVAAEVDGHAENAAASVLGGLVTAAMIDGAPLAFRLSLDDALAFVVLVPDRTLPTREARAALPATIPHGDAGFNLGRMGLLVAGLADHRRLVAEAMDDRVHQQQRTPLFPESVALLDGLRDAGALASAWSGAGPSLLAVCTNDSVDAVQRAGERLLADADVAGRSLKLTPDLEGLVVD
ncbi:MAG TPA: homoserine kinase [Acidimicrobiales bacterium]|nr:homoserine kinase [Acidimicrobiales bacterium]